MEGVKLSRQQPNPTGVSRPTMNWVGIPAWRNYYRSLADPHDSLQRAQPRLVCNHLKPSIGEVVNRTSLDREAPGSIPGMAYSTYRPLESLTLGSDLDKFN